MVHILAGLPESYDVLVTALESGSETVPKQRNKPSQEAMLISHALVATSRREWIVDSGATCQ